MDNVDLSNSPDLSMEDITKQHFNSDFLSDIQFLVEGKVFYAHSWELTKRSIVFREQFRGTFGEHKLITIDDTTYKVFYQFLRFIYTDKCDIEQESICEMLKLALKYKIIKLENTVLNMMQFYDTCLIVFEFTLLTKYELFFNYMYDEIFRHLNYLVDVEPFSQIKPKFLEEILKSDRMPSGITETKLFNTLIRWMDKSCEINQMPKTQRRSHFGHLLRLIRFPLMSSDEFNQCVESHPDLFTTDDISTICSLIVLKANCTNPSWLAEPRLEYVETFEMQKPAPNQKWITKFTVSENLILSGLRCGLGQRDFEIEISGENHTTNIVTASFNFINSFGHMRTISLGETIKLKPNVNYMIEIKYKSAGGDFIFHRKPGVDCIISGSSNLITFSETSKNLFEMNLKLSSQSYMDGNEFSNLIQ